MVFRAAVLLSIWVPVFLSDGSAVAGYAASDNAADPAYGAGWADGSNGGSGWGGTWLLLHNGGGFFVGNSAVNGRGDVNTPPGPAGRAWGISGSAANANRQFRGPMTSGDSFSIDFTNGAIGSPGFQGWELIDYGFELQFEFDTVWGMSDYEVVDESGPGRHTAERDSGIPVTNQGLHCVFTLTGNDTYSLAVTPLVGVATTTITGMVLPTDNIPINAVVIENGEAATDPAGPLYFNNIRLTPEPGVFWPMIAAATLLLRRRRLIA